MGSIHTVSKLELSDAYGITEILVIHCFLEKLKAPFDMKNGEVHTIALGMYKSFRENNLYY